VDWENRMPNYPPGCSGPPEDPQGDWTALQLENAERLEEILSRMLQDGELVEEIVTLATASVTSVNPEQYDTAYKMIMLAIMGRLEEQWETRDDDA
jgi:hypothetical protein